MPEARENGSGARATARFTLRSDETLEMPGPPSFRASKRRGLVGTNLMATNYNYTPNTHATEPLKFLRIRTQQTLTGS